MKLERDHSFLPKRRYWPTREIQPSSLPNDEIRIEFAGMIIHEFGQVGTADFLFSFAKKDHADWHSPHSASPTLYRLDPRHELPFVVGQTSSQKPVALALGDERICIPCLKRLGGL